MIQVKPPGLFSRGKLTLPPSPHITKEALVHQLNQSWGARGFEAYPSKLINCDVILKKSGWTGLAMQIKHQPHGTVILFNAFSPSVMVRLLAMGLIPVLILNANSWKPLVREFCDYAQGCPLFLGQLGGGAAHPQLGPGAMMPGGYGGAPITNAYAPPGAGHPAAQGHPPAQGHPGPGYPQGPAAMGQGAMGQAPPPAGAMPPPSAPPHGWN
ncbi:MAG: hypothetical protein AAF928_18095 [Myxococcota bacterium]